VIAGPLSAAACIFRIIQAEGMTTTTTSERDGENEKSSSSLWSGKLNRVLFISVGWQQWWWWSPSGTTAAAGEWKNSTNSRDLLPSRTFEFPTQIQLVELLSQQKQQQQQSALPVRQMNPHNRNDYNKEGHHKEHFFLTPTTTTI